MTALATAMATTALLQLSLAAFSPAAEALSTAGATADASPPSSASKILRSGRDYRLLEEVPHDASSFTQGLTYFDGHVYEGTGLEGKSRLMRHDPTDGMRTLREVPLSPSRLFGEGISHYHVWRTDERTGNRAREHRLIQLTWKDKVGFVYSLPGMELLREFSYDTHTGEGWGITFVPHRDEFYVSDGSEHLMVWDAETLEEKRRIVVTFEGGKPGGASESVRYVNELEFVDFATDDGSDGAGAEGNDGRRQCAEGGGTTCRDEGSGPSFAPTMRILANIWYQDVIVSIDPMTGKVTRVYDMRDIFPLEQRRKEGSDCLNGISVTGTRKRAGEGLEIWVTGKLWPKMYRIQLID